MYPETLLFNLKRKAIAMAAERALNLAIQQGWTSIEIWTDSTVLMRSLNEVDNTPVNIYLFLEQCRFLKPSFE